MTVDGLKIMGKFFVKYYPYFGSLFIFHETTAAITDVSSDTAHTLIKLDLTVSVINKMWHSLRLFGSIFLYLNDLPMEQPKHFQWNC
jgi:hypothetical protein